jgi:DNA polymerase
MTLQTEIRRFIEQQVELYGDEYAVASEILYSRTSPAPIPVPSLATEEAAEATEAVQTTRVHEPMPEVDLQVASLEQLQERIGDCQRCAISGQRRNLVFGAGNPAADIVLIGEAPGYNEDQQGMPFVGEAGQLLSKILAAIQLQREEVYICNLLKCRPTDNRDPLPGEVQNCLPFLEKQLELIQPAFILCLGRFAAQTMLQSTLPLSQLRGRVHVWRSARLIVTYHPAALLRYPKFKPETWQDVQLLRRLYDEFLANNLPR